MSDLISIIIRTKNEENWIGLCLRSIKSQSYKNYEVIIVDNNSVDYTIEKAKSIIHDISICKIDENKPGKALNLGIENSKGKYIVCLSAHCIPVTENWLANLYDEIRQDEKIAGVYGRQLPTDQTHDIDRRDMYLVFGLDKRVQQKDPFFHNANSIIKKSFWENCPFDNDAVNIEDRIWGQAMINLGYKLIYNPQAMVYHMHGIHQTNKPLRYNNIARIIEQTSSNIESIPLDEYNIIAIIPILSNELKNELKLKVFIDTISILLSIRYFSHVVLTSDNIDILKNTLKTFKIDSQLFLFHQRDYKQKRLLDVYKEVLNHLKNQSIFADIVMTTNISFPIKSKKVMESCLVELLKNDVEAVFPVYSQKQPTWIKSENDYKRVDNYENHIKARKPVYIGLENICMVAYSNKIQGLENFFDNKIEMVEVNNPYFKFKINDINTIDEYNFLKARILD